MFWNDRWNDYRDVNKEEIILWKKVLGALILSKILLFVGCGESYTNSNTGNGTSA